MSGLMVATVVAGSITAYALVAICAARVWYRRRLGDFSIIGDAMDEALPFGLFWPITVPVTALFWIPRVARKLVSHGIDRKDEA